MNFGNRQTRLISKVCIHQESRCGQRTPFVSITYSGAHDGRSCGRENEWIFGRALCAIQAQVKADVARRPTDLVDLDSQSVLPLNESVSRNFKVEKGGFVCAASNGIGGSEIADHSCRHS